MGSIADIYRNITLCHDLKMFTLSPKRLKNLIEANLKFGIKPQMRDGKEENAETYISYDEVFSDAANKADEVLEQSFSRIYLDHASATPLRPEVLEAMMPYLTESHGNPSSIHTEGQQAKAALEQARTHVARLLSVQPECVTFTSGGTESNNLAILGAVKARHESGVPYDQIEIITTAIEHPATSKTFEYLATLEVKVTYAPVDEGGQIIVSELPNLLTPNTLLVSVAYVNSEIGVIQDVGAISRVLAKFSKAHDAIIFLHVDAAQAPLWLPCELTRLGCDLLSLDAGKFGGSKGVGALIHLKRVPLKNSSYGGGQEGGLRPGTESVASIVGFAKAFELAQTRWAENSEAVKVLQDYFFTQLKENIPTAVVNGVQGEYRVANNINISIPGIDSEFAVVSLDVAGIALSTKSACSSAGGGGSTVVHAITHDSNRANTTLRFSLGLNTTTREIQKTIDTLVLFIKNNVH
ncbi:MAG: cysteine desulfurase family protein [Patescibacteria group bacterium]